MKIIRPKSKKLFRTFWGKCFILHAFWTHRPLGGWSYRFAAVRTERLSRVFHSFRRSSAQCPLVAVEASPVGLGVRILIGCKSFLHGSLTLLCVYRCSLCLSLVGCYVIGGLDGIYDGAEGYRTDAFLGDIVLLIFGAMAWRTILYYIIIL